MSNQQEITRNAIIGVAQETRENLNRIEKGIRNSIALFKDADPEALGDKGEVIANAMLALRHIEDCRMRFGKVIQYSQKDMESVYDK